MQICFCVRIGNFTSHAWRGPKMRDKPKEMVKQHRGKRRQSEEKTRAGLGSPGPHAPPIWEGETTAADR